MKIFYTVEINAQIEKTFDCVNNSEKLKLWMEGLQEVNVDPNADKDNPVGAKFRHKIKEGGKIKEYNGEITAYKLPTLLGVRIYDKMFTVDVLYKFESAGDKTILNYEADLVFGTKFAQLLGYLFSWFTKRLLVKQMSNLKALAEK